MQVKTAVIWSLLRGEIHPTLADADRSIEALMPMVDAMFPGINYYSITGFHQVMRELVIPALRARHADVGRMATRDVRPSDTVEVAEVLPSAGYQWQDDPRWMSRFRQATAR